MFGIEILAVMMLIRLIFPVALLIWVGNRVQRNEVKYRFG